MARAPIHGARTGRRRALCRDRDAAANAVRPIGMPLAIVYEDEDLLVIDKPAGLAVHPTQNPDEMTLEHALAAYLRPGETSHPVSRLDRGTTGLMAVAKNRLYARAAAAPAAHDAYFREYRGICVGELVPRAGQIDLPIGFAEGSRYRPRRPRPTARPAAPGMRRWPPGPRPRARCRCCGCFRIRAAPISCASTFPPPGTRSSATGSTAQRPPNALRGRRCTRPCCGSSIRSRAP